MNKKNKTLKQIKQSVKESDPEAEIILYGSFARGNNNKKSDIDLLILIKKENISREEENKISAL